MAGRFEGLSDLEWKLFADVFKERGGGKGMPRVKARLALNSILYVLYSGCRWCDLPRGRKWASKSSAHRALKRWHDDGTLRRLKERMLALAEEKGCIHWEYGAIDGAFSPWERRR